MNKPYKDTFVMKTLVSLAADIEVTAESFSEFESDLGSQKIAIGDSFSR